MEKINFGIRKDLQADFRYEPNACKGFVLDISLGCPHKCIYCLFSPLELLVYKLQNPGYKEDILPLKLDNLLKKEEFPPAVYMCYSSDPLGNDVLIESTLKILEKLFSKNVSVLFITKGVFNDKVIELIKTRPELMEIQIDLASADDERNSLLEPNAPTYLERLKNIEKLSKIDRLGSLTLRIDPMFPGIDDTEENITKIMKDISKYNVKEAVFGYIVLTSGMISTLKHYDFLKKSTDRLIHKTDTISGQELFSISFNEKVERLTLLENICNKYGVNMSVCGCKEHEFKKSKFNWICHPYNRKKRETLFKNTDLNMDIDIISHLK